MATESRYLGPMQAPNPRLGAATDFLNILLEGMNSGVICTPLEAGNALDQFLSDNDRYGIPGIDPMDVVAAAERVLDPGVPLPDLGIFGTNVFEQPWGSLRINGHSTHSVSPIGPYDVIGIDRAIDLMFSYLMTEPEPVDGI